MRIHLVAVRPDMDGIIIPGKVHGLAPRHTELPDDRTSIG